MSGERFIKRDKVAAITVKRAAGEKRAENILSTLALVFKFPLLRQSNHYPVEIAPIDPLPFFLRSGWRA